MEWTRIIWKAKNFGGDIIWDGPSMAQWSQTSPQMIREPKIGDILEIAIRRSHVIQVLGKSKFCEVNLIVKETLDIDQDGKLLRKSPEAICVGCVLESPEGKDINLASDKKVIMEHMVAHHRHGGLEEYRVATAAQSAVDAIVTGGGVK